MVSRKIIKKLIQFAVILLLIVIAIPATALLLLQSNSIQNRLAGRVMQIVSEKLDTKFTISSIDIAFLYRIRLNDVYLEDLSGDTLIYANSITTGIRYIDPLGKSVSIGSINLEKAVFNLVTDSVTGSNLKYFIEKLKSPDKKDGKWNIEFNNFRLNNSRFSLRNTHFQPKEYGINFKDLLAYNINADIRQFKPSPDSLSFYVKSLQLKEKSGFVVEEMSTRFSQARTFLSFRDVEIKTRDSDIRGDEISLRFSDFKSFEAETFTDSVRLRVNISNSRVRLSDIGYFTTVFRNVNEPITISGLVTGPVANIRGKDLSVKFGRSSGFSGNFQFEGLPDIKQTFILADIEEFSTSTGDINSLSFPGIDNINLPGQLEKLGKITYTGNFTGFVNDFVAYGTFNSDLGVVRTDLLFRPDTSNMLSFQGKLNAHDFNLGSLIDASDKVGNISLSAVIEGATLEGKSINASLKGLIERFEFMQYEYANISLAGDLNNKKFNGSVDILDPNIDLEFLGKVDFTDSIPSFDFTANISEANLYALNINRSDPEFRASCYLIAKAKGSSINSLNGEIKLLNSHFIRKGKELQIYDLNLFSESHQGNNLLQLRSDLLDAELSGDFELSQAGETFNRFLNVYLPSLLDNAKIEVAPNENSIEFTSTIKNIKPLFDFFLPEYAIAENSSINLSYNPNLRQMKIHLNADYIKAKSLLWENMVVNGFSNEGILQIDAGSKKLVVGNSLNFEHFTVTANASSDTVGVHVRWNNWDDTKYKGTISALAKISKPDNVRNPHIEIDIRPSEFYARDTLWNIQRGYVIIDSTSIQFNNLAINHKDDYFRVEGTISEDLSDELNIFFHRFNLANLSAMSATSQYNLGGILNGSAKISGIYSNPLFTSILKVDSLVINNEMLGTMEVNSSWDDTDKSIQLEAFALRDNLKTIDIRGEYVPAGEGRLDFEMEMDKLRLNLFNPYVSTIFDDLRGIASGKASLKGTLSEPVINGELNLQKTSLTINYLQTRYSFSDKVRIVNNIIYFDDIRLYDAKGNSAWLNGTIRNRHLKDFVLDVNIRMDNFMSLNTTQAHNNRFYGAAFATGAVRIQGPPKNIVMDITATTNQNTSVKIPLSNIGELNEYPFIEITNIYGDKDSGDEVKFGYQADLSGIQMRFRLTVTPDAEVQIIIDPQLGEIIKGKGTGSFDIRISKSGGFLMTGDYVIEEGDYLFNLMGFTNKKLTIEPGGLIRWNGDPLDATVDIIANYRTQSSLRDLFGEGINDDKKLVVEDRVILSGKLMSPDIKYDIHLPDADESTRLLVNSAMTTSEEKSRQFISLLVNKKFTLSQGPGGQSDGNTSISGAAGVTFSELITNQFSNWLSQIYSDVNVNVNYRPNREMNTDEMQVALSSQLFNDRLIINANVDMSTRNASTTNAARDASSEIVGEFDIEYKLTEKFRLKTFNHANNELLYQDKSTYTQGLGFSYKEEFNSFGELIRRLFGRKEESPEVKKEEDNAGSGAPVVNNYR